MKTSPLAVKQFFTKLIPSTHVTPKKKTKGSATKTKSPISNSSNTCSSRKVSAKKIQVKQETNSYETFHKELLDYQNAYMNSSMDGFGTTNGLKYSESNENINKKNLIKCKYHDEEYNFFSTDDKKFLCSKCLYSKYEKIIPGTWKGSVIPIEKCNDIINQENLYFVEIECQQYLRHLQRTISNCNHNNNYLTQKHEEFQNTIATEFNKLSQLLKKKEEDLTERVNRFFDNAIKENIHQLQNFKFFLDNINKIKEFGKYRTPENNMIQFSFANKLKKALESTPLNIPKIVEKDFDILGTTIKDKAKREIERLGKPLEKCLEALICEPKLTKSPNESISPMKETRRSTHRENNSFTEHKRSTSGPNKLDLSIKLKPTKPSSEYIRLKELEALINSDLTHIFSADNVLFEDSSILSDAKLREEALDLFPITLSRTKKLYSLTKNGASSQIFHEKCDGYASCIVLVKTEGKFIFGYYSPLQFMANDKYSGIETYWIFSLKNNFGRGIIFKVKPEKNFIALYNSSKSPCLGSTIKGKEDLLIDFDNLSASCSNIGYAYKLWDSKIEGAKVLSGKHTGWTFDEIEVYQVEE